MKWLSLRAVTGLAMVLSVCTLVATAGCGGLSRHTSDAHLIRIFQRHREDFERLRKAVLGADGFTSISEDFCLCQGRMVNFNEIKFSRASYIAADPGLKEIDDLRRTIGVWGVFLAPESDQVEFRFDPASIWNGASEKGVIYLPERPTGILPSLDSYQLDRLAVVNSYGDRLAYRAIADHWYLYVHVSG